jgi:hypothetical protein
MTERTQQRITPQAHKALKAYRITSGMTMERIASDAIIEYIARRNIARRWDEEAGKFVHYTVDYPDGEPAGSTET